jgi:hypothetical protein
VASDYWIYFVPLSAAVNKETLSIVMIQHPVQMIKSGLLLEEACSWTLRTPRKQHSFVVSSAIC